MKAAFRLAWSLIRIRHLMFSLFFLPLLCSVLLVFGQLVVTGMFLNAATSDVEGTEVPEKEDNAVRFLLYGSGEQRPPLKVCRWIPNPLDPSREIAPTRDCSADSLDVAINVDNPDAFVADRYVDIFEGQIDRLHICKRCSPNAVIRVASDGEISTRASSVYALAVLSLTLAPKREVREEQRDHLKQIRENLGDILFFMPDSKDLVLMSPKNGAIAFTANIVPLVIIALWLAVRAHRKVLDYFSNNNVLLPLVAATGKRTFYSALWILTALRVGCFLAASLPILYFGLLDIKGDDAFESLHGHTLLIGVWLCAAVSAVALSTIVTSIADLKHRQEWYTFVYRYVPIVIALGGSFAWGASFIIPNHAMALVRNTILSIPVLGLGPLFVAPITLPATMFVAIHAMISVVCMYIIVRRNARWFGAHLEEI